MTIPCIRQKNSISFLYITSKKTKQPKTAQRAEEFLPKMVDDNWPQLIREQETQRGI